jgi:phospholipid/cholesterol/gamma-HCH transport system substrate-binding protein
MHPDQVDVVLDIERGTPIRRDTIATLSTRGFDRRGFGGAERRRRASLAAGEGSLARNLPVIQAGPSLVARLDDAFNNILTNMNSLSNRLERLLGNDNQICLDPRRCNT